MKTAPIVAIAMLLALAWSPLPTRADLAPEVAERLRASVVLIESESGSRGTGFFIGDTGLLLTCSHVLDSNPGRVKIQFSDETKGVAEFVSFDHYGLDLAALRLVDATPPAWLELGDDTVPRPGQRIYQAGNPYPLFPSLMSTGIMGQHRQTHSIFVHDAATSSGSSGSPVVDADGNLLGMSISIATDDSGNPENSFSTGFAYALDTPAIRAFLDRLAKGERSEVKTGHVEFLRYPLPTLTPGETVRSRLTTEADRFDGDLSYSEGYVIDLTENDLLILTLESRDFDTYLMLYDNDASMVSKNDDAFEGTGTDSKIVLDVPETGRYVVVATSLGPGETGRYNLRAEAIRFAGSDVRELELSPDDPMAEDGAAYQTHSIQGRPGRWLSVTMRSQSLDSVLRLLGPDGSVVAENDDWQEGSLDARILTPIEAEGEYKIVATTFGEGEGAYELEITWSEE